MKSSKNSRPPFLFISLLSLVMTFVLFYAGAPEPLNPDSLSQTASTSDPQVLGRSYPLPQADIRAGEGGTITDLGVSVIVSEGTFSSDVYLRVDRTLRGNPVSAQGMWQVSDMWNVRLRYMANDDEVPLQNTKKKFILAFPYTQDYLKSDQGVQFDENKLKLLRGETETGPWVVLADTVVDTVNKKVSVVTDRGGYFTVGGGFYEGGAATGGAGVGVGGSAVGVVLKPNEVVVTVTPSPEPTEEVGETDRVLENEAEPLPTGVPVGGGELDDNFFTALFEMIKSLLRIP